MARLERLSKLVTQVLASLTGGVGVHVLAKGIDPQRVKEDARKGCRDDDGGGWPSRTWKIP